MLLIVREDGGRGDPSEMVNATGNVGTGLEPCIDESDFLLEQGFAAMS